MALRNRLVQPVTYNINSERLPKPKPREGESARLFFPWRALWMGRALQRVTSFMVLLVARPTAEFYKMRHMRYIIIQRVSIMRRARKSPYTCTRESLQRVGNLLCRARTARGAFAHSTERVVFLRLQIVPVSFLSLSFSPASMFFFTDSIDTSLINIMNHMLMDSAVCAILLA